MKTAITVTHTLVRLTGLIQIVLGLLFWIGYARNLIPAHILVGLLFVLSLWTLAILAARAGVPLGLVALALVWGVIVVVLGVTQTQLLPGPFHWVIEVLHLLVGLAAIGLGGRLATMSKHSQVPALSA